MNKKTNYLSEIGCGEFTSKSLRITKNVGTSNWIRTINKKNYVDPDSKCKQLYDDFLKHYVNKKFPNGNIISKAEVKSRNKNNKQWYELVVTISNRENVLIAQVGLGADYIGPSIYWACEAGLSSEEIGNYLVAARTFGGHILWPRWIGVYNQNKSLTFVDDFLSINEWRGGENGFYDRIDLTLFDINEWYLEQRSKLSEVYEKNRFWLEQFNNFEGFIDFFNLNMYVEKKNCNNYKIKNLCSFNCGNEFEYLSSKDVYPAMIPSERVAYLKFADANVFLIKERNTNILICKYNEIIQKLFPNGGENYTLEALKLEFEKEGIIDESCFNDALDNCISEGWITDCGNGTYTR